MYISESIMLRHKFIPLPQQASNGALLYCEYCGAKDNESRPGCTPIVPEQGNELI